MLPNVLNGKYIAIVFDEIVKDEDFQKSDTDKETYESIEESEFPQQYEDGGIFLLDDFNKKNERSSSKTMFKRSRHNKLSIFIINQDYYELPKRTIRANRNMYHNFKPNISSDVQCLYQDKSSMDMTLNEFNLLIYIRWNEKYQPLTIDMTKVKYTGRYQLGLNPMFDPKSSPFYVN